MIFSNVNQVSSVSIETFAKLKSPRGPKHQRSDVGIGHLFENPIDKPNTGSRFNDKLHMGIENPSCVQ